MVNAELVLFALNASHDYGAAGWPTRNRYTEWFCGRFALLLDKLAGYDEGGRSVLDNTVVFWWSEHGCGNHNYDMMPIIVAGSQIVLKLMDRFPVIITLGAMLLGWIAGQMVYTDPGLKDWLPACKTWEYVAAAIGAFLVYAIGRLLQRLSLSLDDFVAAAALKQGSNDVYFGLRAQNTSGGGLGSSWKLYNDGTPVNPVPAPGGLVLLATAVPFGLGLAARRLRRKTAEAA